MHQLAEASGWVASGCVLAAFLMRRMRPLRLAAIASNAAFIAYAAQLELLPILLLHTALLPINLWRLWEQGRAGGAPRGLPRAGWAVAALLLAVLLAPGPAAGGEASAPPVVEVRSLDAGGLGGTLLVPARRPPNGLVLLLPDGPDADARGAPYAEQLLGAGFAVFDALRGGEDAAAAARAVAELPAAAGLGPLPVAVLGFGAGARVALRLGPGVAARVLLYPGCASPAEDDAGADPLLLLHGAAEAGGEACAALAAWLARDGRPVRRIAYAGAYYAWDYPAYGDGLRILLPRPDGAEGLVPALPWPELAAMSAAQAAGFLATALGRAGAP